MTDTLFSTPVKYIGRQRSPAAHTPGADAGGPRLCHTSVALHTTPPPPPAKDRFIAHRGSQDSSVSHFLLTTDDPVTPFLLSHQTTPQGQRHAAAVMSPGPGAASGRAAAFTLSPSPARSLLFGASGTGSNAGAGTAVAGSVGSLLLGSSRSGVEPSPARTIGSLFTSPNRFDSEVGVDAAIDDDALSPEDGYYSSAARLGRSLSGAVAPGDTGHHSPFGGTGASSKLVNVEPYNARLARSLFADVPQTSVLCHAGTPTPGEQLRGRHRTPTAVPAAPTGRGGDDAGVSPVDGRRCDSSTGRKRTAGAGGGSMERVLRRGESLHNSFRSPLRSGSEEGAEDEDEAERAGRGLTDLERLRHCANAVIEAGAAATPDRDVSRRLQLFEEAEAEAPVVAARPVHGALGPLSAGTRDLGGSLSTTTASCSLRGGRRTTTLSDCDEEDEAGMGVAMRGADEGSEVNRFDQRPAVVFGRNRSHNFASKTFRHISSTPDRILAADKLVDEFYYNVLDCSCNNTVAVALEASVYLWEWATEQISMLPCEAVNVCAVRWAPDGQRLATSNEDGDVVISDAKTQKDEAVFTVHQQRVCALAWNATGNILASGSKESTIILSDTRSKTPALTLKGHEKEVCGLQWSLQDLYLASGADDNKVCIWDSRRLDIPLHTLGQHVSAVKALAWNPSQPHLLASGGGVDDKMLRFWAADTGECVRAMNTNSQVCGLVWNLAGTEVVSCHGTPSSHVTVWRYPSLSRVIDLSGHRERVLHLCLSGDGSSVISAGSDYTVRFWSCFPPGPNTPPAPVQSTQQTA